MGNVVGGQVSLQHKKILAMATRLVGWREVRESLLGYLLIRLLHGKCSLAPAIGLLMPERSCDLHKWESGGDWGVHCTCSYEFVDHGESGGLRPRMHVEADT